MTTLREQIMRLVGALRGRGVRISVAEAIDALKAVAATGLERVPMREALATALIKDESDRQIFDETFSAFFAAPVREPAEARGAASLQSLVGRGRRGEDSHQPLEARPEPASGRPSRREAAQEEPEVRKSESEESPDRAEPAIEAEQQSESGRDTREQAGREHLAGHDAAEAPRLEAQRQARLRAAERKPFTQYSDFDYEVAREALKPLARRFRVRVGRRLRMARRGRLDFRRTIRAATQRGGALLDLRFRARRPRRVDLLILADVSGSVRYSSTLMLELVAGARLCFRRIRSFVYIDRLAEADFEDHHLVMTPALDLYARSDFGRVLSELWRRRDELLGRATLLVIMGDARNNRRPPRADLLREIARICRAVIWLNPEETSRWGTGDSAIGLYERELSALLPARNLRELEAGLLRVG